MVRYCPSERTADRIPRPARAVWFKLLSLVEIGCRPRILDPTPHTQSLLTEELGEEAPDAAGVVCEEWVCGVLASVQVQQAHAPWVREAPFRHIIRLALNSNPERVRLSVALQLSP